MAHWSENSHSLAVRQIVIPDRETLLQVAHGFGDVCLIWLPFADEQEPRIPFLEIGQWIAELATGLGPEATLVTIGATIDLVQVQAQISSAVRYQNWIVIQRERPLNTEPSRLPSSHFGALIHTRYTASLRHTKTRVQYTYCPVCNKTTKDYGGKKHTYHEYGTLLSDVWRDLACDPAKDITPVLIRFADLFGLEPYQELLVLDCRTIVLSRGVDDYMPLLKHRTPFIHHEPGISYHRASQPTLLEALPFSITPPPLSDASLPEHLVNQILLGDCLEQLAIIPDNTIDFVFTDPPYNLGKNYSGYSDDLEIRDYFEWCDRWIAELARVLKPGRTCAILNIPLWSVRHFLFLATQLEFQNWIVWDALAFPVRFIMPAHYTILAFSKGPARLLPGLTGQFGPAELIPAVPPFQALAPLAEGYCLRAACVAERQRTKINDRGLLTDVWSDIYRLKHNSRRVDHPTQLPPQLLYRLIALFTRPGEVVLDCFNGSGTTTLAAHQTGRRYLGIEKAPQYRDLALTRHREIEVGLDPFRKADRELTAKNSPVPRRPKQKYIVPKKVLQLEVKRVAQELGHLPSREELTQYGRYPIQYYDEYFASWGEVCAAARTTGMVETRQAPAVPAPIKGEQLSLELES